MQSQKYFLIFLPLQQSVLSPSWEPATGIQGDLGIEIMPMIKKRQWGGEAGAGGVTGAEQFYTLAYLEYTLGSRRAPFLALFF